MSEKVFFPDRSVIENLLYLETQKKTLEVPLIAFSCQFSIFAVKQKTAFRAGSRPKEIVYVDRLLNLFLVIFILIRKVYTKRKKMSTNDIFFPKNSR